MTGWKSLSAAALTATLALWPVTDADAFSGFKGRYSGLHPMCRLEPGTQVWPLEDIGAVGPRATSGAICPGADAVSNCQSASYPPRSPMYQACQSILQQNQACRRPPQPELGNESDKQFWAGVAPYRPWPDRNWYDLKYLGTFDVPVDIEVRIHFITEADPHYEFVAPGFEIGDQTIHAPPYTGHVGSDPRTYWGGWPHDCGSCHNPHRYSRGPIHYWFGDNLESPLRPRGGSPRTTAAFKLERGSHDITARARCYPRDKNGCGTHVVYQQRMRIEFLRCQ